MNEITHSPVLQALERLQTMSADEEVRRLAFVRERAIADEASALRHARKEGVREGRQEGEASLLERQLTRKFGPLSEAWLQRLRTASASSLETWAMKVLEARSLDEVLEP